MSVIKREASPNWQIEFAHRSETVRKTSRIPLTRPKQEAEKIERLWRIEIDQRHAAGLDRQIAKAEQNLQLRDAMRDLRTALLACVVQIDTVIDKAAGATGATMKKPKPYRRLPKARKYP